MATATGFIVLETMAINLSDVTTICKTATAYYIHRRSGVADTIIVDHEVDKKDYERITLWFEANQPKSPYLEMVGAATAYQNLSAYYRSSNRPW